MSGFSAEKNGYFLGPRLVAVYSTNDSGLIATYIASRTVGVPIVGIEYYVGKLDMISKVLQVMTIRLLIYLTFSIRKIKVIERIHKKNMR
jgi:hypothetical protein